MNTNGHERRCICILLVAVLLVPLTSHAFLFGKKIKEKKEEISRKYILRVPDKAAEREMLNLFQQKRIILEEVTVLERLKEEKLRELAEFNRQLMNEFAMDAEGRYEYDPADKVIYRVEKDTGGKQVHKRLIAGPQSSRFASLHAGKQLVMEELRVFVLVVDEKKSEMARVDKRLADRFLIKNDRNYQYESKTMRLFEIIMPEPVKEKEETVNLETLFQAPVPLSR